MLGIKTHGGVLCSPTKWGRYKLHEYINKSDFHAFITLQSFIQNCWVIYDSSYCCQASNARSLD